MGWFSPLNRLRISCNNFTHYAANKSRPPPTDCREEKRGGDSAPKPCAYDAVDEVVECVVVGEGFFNPFAPPFKHKLPC